MKNIYMDIDFWPNVMNIDNFPHSATFLLLIFVDPSNATKVMGLLRTMVWLPSVVFRLIMKGDLLHTKNNTLRQWSRLPITTKVTLPQARRHDITLLYYSKLFRKYKRLVKKALLSLDGWPYWVNNRPLWRSHWITFVMEKRGGLTDDAKLEINYGLKSRLFNKVVFSITW